MNAFGSREFYVLTSFTIHITLSLYVWFLEGFDILHTYILYVYIIYTHYIYIIIDLSHHEQVCLMRLFQEIPLVLFGLIKLVHNVINLLYYKHSREKWKYIPYISVPHKVLKSFRSKMATSTHDICNEHGASSTYKKTCWQSSFIYVYVYYIYMSPSHQPKICSFTTPHTLREKPYFPGPAIS